MHVFHLHFLLIPLPLGFGSPSHVLEPRRRSRERLFQFPQSLPLSIPSATKMSSSSPCETLSSRPGATQNDASMPFSPPASKMPASSGPWPACFIDRAPEADDSKNNNAIGAERRPSCDDTGGWTSLQSLFVPHGNRVEAGRSDKPYVHPLLKRTAAKLSDRSLEMCTESLGSETGSKSGDELISLLSVEEKESRRPPQAAMDRKITRPSNAFPPPITSLSGSTMDGIRVMQQRAEGRLTLQAVTVTPPPSCFRAERSEGRLRLRLSEDWCHRCNSVTTLGKDRTESLQGDEGAGEEDEEEEHEEEDEEGDEKGEDTNANVEINADGGSGCEQTPGRPSRRCKEGGHEQKVLLSWEQVLIASS